MSTGGQNVRLGLRAHSDVASLNAGLSLGSMAGIAVTLCLILIASPAAPVSGG